MANTYRIRRSSMIGRLGRVLLVVLVAIVALQAARQVGTDVVQTNLPKDALATLYLLDVGQGDAIHMRFQNGTDMLIDGGRGTAVLEQMAKTLPWTDRRIEHVFLTHPDADHVEGLVPVLERYDVVNVYDAYNRSGTRVDDTFATTVEARAQTHHSIDDGNTIDLGLEHVQLDVLWPQDVCTHVHEEKEESVSSSRLPEHESCPFERNDRSLVMRLTVGRTSVLLTGDIERDAEQRLLEYTSAELLRADILKAAHHGSGTSSYPPLMRVVDPKTVLISAGRNNSYGHPHPGALRVFEELQAEVFRTDEQGRIRCDIYAHSYTCEAVERVDVPPDAH